MAATSTTPARLPSPPDSRAPRVTDSGRGTLLVGFVTILLFFGGFGTWAALAPLDSAAMAPGIIAVEGNRRTLQHKDGGIIEDLLVEEGQRVDAGQPLIVLDDTELRAQLEVLTGQYVALRALEARLEAEQREDEGITFMPELEAQRASDDRVETLLANQENLFDARMRAFEGQVSVMEQRIVQLGEQISGFRAQEASQSDQLRLVKDEINDVSFLFDQGLSPKSRLLALERNAAALEGQRGELIANIASAQEQINETRLEILQLKRERMTEISDLLRDTQQQLYDVIPRIDATRDKLERTLLRAPISGAVVGLSVFTIGGVIAPGERLLDIVPEDSKLVVDARIQPRDIDQVHAGMGAEVHLTAFNQRSMPIIHGKILRVSADRITPPEAPDQAHYSAMVEIDPAELSKLPDISLKPGMPADVMIPLKARTMLDYFIEPITASMDKAFREE